MRVFREFQKGGNFHHGPPRVSSAPETTLTGNSAAIVAATCGSLMSNRFSDLDLAALLCSRVCHDVISPVGAIANGLEMLDEEDDEEMRKLALDLVRRSASQASPSCNSAASPLALPGGAGS